MPGLLLTTNSQIGCPHGGIATLTTSDTSTSAGAGGKVLLETDVHPVAGCSFTMGTKYSPCTRIEWSAGASKVTVGGTAVLIKTSVGKCLSGEGAPQGVALVKSTQQKATAT